MHLPAGAAIFCVLAIIVSTLAIDTKVTRSVDAVVHVPQVAELIESEIFNFCDPGDFAGITNCEQCWDVLCRIHLQCECCEQCSAYEEKFNAADKNGDDFIDRDESRAFTLLEAEEGDEVNEEMVQAEGEHPPLAVTGYDWL